MDRSSSVSIRWIEVDIDSTSATCTKTRGSVGMLLKKNPNTRLLGPTRLPPPRGTYMNNTCEDNRIRQAKFLSYLFMSCQSLTACTASYCPIFSSTTAGLSHVMRSSFRNPKSEFCSLALMLASKAIKCPIESWLCLKEPIVCYT